MQPHRRKNKSKAGGLAGAKLLMKSRLGWLSGYPRVARGGVEWVVVPYEGSRPIETVRLDRRMLSRATYGAKKLRGEFPRALPRLVGDAGAWFAAVMFQIDLLKSAVHDGASPPVSLFEVDGRYQPQVRQQAAEVCEREPRVAPLVAALSWVLCARPGEARRYLAWADANRDALAAMPAAPGDDDALPMVIQLAHVARSAGARAVEPLMSLLAQPDLAQTPLALSKEYAAQLKKCFADTAAPGDAPARPPSPLSRLLREHAAWLVTLDAKAQRRAMRLLDAAAIGQLIARWRRWWGRIDAPVERARAMHRRPTIDPARLAALRRGRTRIDTLMRTMPPQIARSQPFGAVRRIVEADDAALAPAVRRMLELLRRGGQGALAPLFLLHWGLHATRHSQLAASRITAIVSRACDYLRCAGVTPESLTPWLSTIEKEAARGYECTGLTYELLAPDFQTADIARCFDAMAGVHRRTGAALSEPIIGAIINLIGITHDAQRVAGLIERLIAARQSDRHYAREVLCAAVALSAPSHEWFAQVVAALDRMARDDMLALGGSVAPLRDAFADRAALIQTLLVGPDARGVAACARKLATLRKLRIGCAFELSSQVFDADAAWIGRYPVQLHAPLRILVGAHPDAEQAAARLMRSTLRSAASLRQERGAIKRSLARADGEQAARLVRRLANLDQRLAAGTAVAPGKLKRLAEKVHRAAGRSLIDRIDADASAALRHGLGPAFGLPDTPRCMLAPAALSLIAAVAGLDKSMRRLAGRIFAARAADPPWDLRDEPANRAFIDVMSARGLDMRPWLDGIGPRRHAIDDERITFELEADPLAVMQMGVPFQTCLSPGDVNFFSAVANAADVNKRVVYARAGQRIVARCLLAITDDGSLVVFRTYAHTDHETVQRHVTDFARELATAMGARIVPRGHVPRLLSSDWYDDGAVDAGGQFECFEEGSAFRRALETIEPDAADALVEQNLAPLGLNAVTLPLLLNLPELRKRPRLVVPLVPRMRRIDELSDETVLMIAERLRDADRLDLLSGRGVERIAAHLHRRAGNGWWIAQEQWDLLAGLDASVALRTLKSTRRRGVRRWLEETEPQRVLAAAAAMAALNRTRQAALLCRHALQVAWDKADRRVARDRLAALDQPGAG